MTVTKPQKKKKKCCLNFLTHKWRQSTETDVKQYKWCSFVLHISLKSQTWKTDPLWQTCYFYIQRKLKEFSFLFLEIILTTTHIKRKVFCLFFFYWMGGRGPKKKTNKTKQKLQKVMKTSGHKPAISRIPNQKFWRSIPPGGNIVCVSLARSG